MPAGAGLGISTAWLSLSINEAYYDAYRQAEIRLMEEPSWVEWLNEYLNFPQESQVLTFDDVKAEKVRVRRRTKEVSLTIPVSRLDQAWREGRIVAEFAEVVRYLYVTWADRKGLPAPPELPRIPA